MVPHREWGLIPKADGGGGGAKIHVGTKLTPSCHENRCVKNNAGGDREENDFPSAVVDPGSVGRSAGSPPR